VWSSASSSAKSSRGEQGGGSTDIGPDDVRTREPEGVGAGDDELAHRPRREQPITTLRMTEPGQVYRH
jgi:hypothetical protein